MKKQKRIDEKQYKKDIYKYEFFRKLLSKPLCRSFGFDIKYNTLPTNVTPYLIMANHTTDADIFLTALSFPHMYFVASEHIFSWGLLSGFISSVLHPISRRKGSADALTVLEMRRRLKLGANVGIFPEGGRSPSGVTEKLHPTTVRLIRSCRCGLVTFRIKGGFLTQPRFSSGFRRGKMTGEVVHIYSKENIDEMSDGELYALLDSDLYENAYETQKTSHIPFYCKRPGRYLETSLYICPKCNGLSTLKSNDKGISCTCGFNTVFDEYGNFSDLDINFNGWYNYQRAALEALVTNDSFSICDTGLSAVTVGANHKRTKTDITGLRMDKNSLTLIRKGGNEEINLSKIQFLTVYGVNRIVFSCGEYNYAISGSKRFNAQKYVDTYNIFKTGEATQ